MLRECEVVGFLRYFAYTCRRGIGIRARIFDCASDLVITILIELEAYVANVIDLIDVYVDKLLVDLM